MAQVTHKHYNLKSDFLADLNAVPSNISLGDLVYIQDTKQIYTWGAYFGGNDTGSIISLTYAELKNLVDNSLLVQGSFYRITDFRTRYATGEIVMVQGAATHVIAEATIEPLIVMANSNKTFYEQAISESNPKHTIYYEFNNTLCKNIDLYPLTGYITWRKDDRGNSSYFDNEGILIALAKKSVPSYDDTFPYSRSNEVSYNPPGSGFGEGAFVFIRTGIIDSTEKVAGVYPDNSSYWTLLHKTDEYVDHLYAYKGNIISSFAQNFKTFSSDCFGNTIEKLSYTPASTESNIETIGYNVLISGCSGNIIKGQATYNILIGELTYIDGNLMSVHNKNNILEGNSSHNLIYLGSYNNRIYNSKSLFISLTSSLNISNSSSNYITNSNNSTIDTSISSVLSYLNTCNIYGVWACGIVVEEKSTIDNIRFTYLLSNASNEYYGVLESQIQQQSNSSFKKLENFIFRNYPGKNNDFNTGKNFAVSIQRSYFSVKDYLTSIFRTSDGKQMSVYYENNIPQYNEVIN